MDRLGGYVLKRTLGQGAMGVVYLAEEPELDREVAVKIIAPHLLAHTGFRERFTREARALARLNSGHVVQVYRYGEEDGSLFIVTQLVPDGDLGHLLKQDGVPPVGTALDLIAQVAEGLADAHDAGLIHRDIKPGNILIRRRDRELTAYLSDFGIARAADADATGAGLTKAGTAVGTPAYMAPELHVGRPASVSSDLYSLGCLLWETLTGTTPFPGSTPFEVIAAHVEQPIPQLPGSGPVVDGINRILRSSMAKQPEDRFSSARAMRAALLRVYALARHIDVPVDAMPMGSGPKTMPAERRGPSPDPHAGAPAPWGAPNLAPTPGANPSLHHSPTPLLGSGGATGPGPGQDLDQGRAASQGGRGRLVGILVGVGVLVVAAVVIGVAIATGGDGGGGGGDPTDPETSDVPIEAVDAPQDASVEEFCTASNDLPTDETGDDFAAEAQQANDWAAQAIKVGTPAEMSEEERHGFELWADYQRTITAEDLESDREAEAWRDDFGFSDAADVFIYLGYVGSNCV